MKIQSTPLMFIDQTDSRKLEVYIKSNLPTVQIYNSNTGAYTPDWREGEKLTLTADVFLDSRVMTATEYSGTDIKWYIDEISDDAEIQNNRNQKTLQITTNELATNPIVTYICESTYQGIVASTRLTFARVDTGVDGEKGADGTSVKILGTADSVALVPNTNYYTITYSEGAIIAAALGDAYVYGGELYVCSVLDGEGTNDYFVNVGPIQGQKGEDAKSIVLSGNSQTFKVSKTNAITPSTITVVAQASNTSISSWSYSTNGGQTFLSTIPAGVVRDGNIVTITGSTLSTNSLVIKASDGTIEDVFTVYKVFDGADGIDGEQGDPAPLAFLTNENVSFAANESGQVLLSTFTTNVVAYKGTEKVIPVLGEISGFPTGMTVSEPITTLNEVILTFSIESGSTLGSPISNHGTITIPVIEPIGTNLKLSWSKINTGATGIGLPGDDAITFQVYSNNGYTLSTSVPTIALQTFAYIGDVEIKAGATYQWYRHNGTDWVAISDATNDYFNVSRDDVSFSNNYMCKMQFNSAEYVGVVTIEDKNDEHRVFASKPSNYFSGDLWVVGNDYIPSGFVVGSMLKAEHTNTAYADSDWVLATRYDEEIDDLKSKTGEYGQYFSINEDGGLQVGDATINDNTIYVGRVETTAINTKEANIESPLTVSGRYSGSTMLQAPIINLGNFSLVVESNGSLSIIANT